MYVKCLRQLMREYVDDDRKVLVLWARKEGDGGRAVETMTGRTDACPGQWENPRCVPCTEGPPLTWRLAAQRHVSVNADDLSRESRVHCSIPGFLSNDWGAVQTGGLRLGRIMINPAAIAIIPPMINDALKP